LRKRASGPGRQAGSPLLLGRAPAGLKSRLRRDVDLPQLEVAGPYTFRAAVSCDETGILDHDGIRLGALLQDPVEAALRSGAGGRCDGHGTAEGKGEATDGGSETLEHHCSLFLPMTAREITQRYLIITWRTQMFFQ
jgi:hypothetical protein